MAQAQNPLTAASHWWGLHATPRLRYPECRDLPAGASTQQSYAQCLHPLEMEGMSSARETAACAGYRDASVSNNCACRVGGASTPHI